VVAFDTGGIPEVVRRGETGLLTPLFDRSGFDRAVAALVADKHQRLKMGAAAARYIREHHDLDRNYRQLEQLLIDVITRRRKRANA
jgi:glycosyltransferase involved in cell wall biosynthesis